MRLWSGILRPRHQVLGQELAGDVESVGKDVRSFKTGDRVFATTGIGLGAYAEYICLRENPETGAIAVMPANQSYEEAAAVPYGGGEASEFLRKANVRSGQKVLVNGAGGSFGTYAVQLAKVLGAHVTAVDSAPKLEMLRSIGADRVIEYSQEDFTEGPETYDVIFDVVRNTRSGSMVKIANDDGCLLMANPGFLQLVGAFWASRGSKRRVVFGVSGTTSEDLADLRGLVEGEAAPGNRSELPARADGRGSQVCRDRAQAGEHRCRRCLGAALLLQLTPAAKLHLGFEPLSARVVLCRPVVLALGPGENRFLGVPPRQSDDRQRIEHVSGDDESLKPGLGLIGRGHAVGHSHELLGFGLGVDCVERGAEYRHGCPFRSTWRR